MKKLRIKAFNNRLVHNVLLYVLLGSFFLAIVSISIQLYSDFRNDLTDLDQRFSNIKSSYVDSIEDSLWDFNEPLLNVQINGIVKLPDIRYAKIITGLGKTYQAGDVNVKTKKKRIFPLKYGDEKIGTLEVFADYSDIYKSLEQRAGFTAISQFIQIFLIAFFIVGIIHMMITRPIFKITDFYKNSTVDNLDEALVIGKRPKNKNEIDFLIDSINETRIDLQQDIIKRKEAERALINLSGELEIKVYDRTEKLVESNKQLQQSFDDLTLLKDQLVQSEKMASLGQLVAGVAHEVNTPLGICVTSISAMSETVRNLTNKINSQQLTRRQLTTDLALLAEYQTIIERSINKAVKLIRSFKSVAVDQHSDVLVTINLAQYTKNIVTTVKTLFKHKNYHINLDIDKNLTLTTYPSAWNQILTNLMMNSHYHGFDGRQNGHISINFSVKNNQLILDYKDDGHGIDESIKDKIFDPFVTTKRGQGGSGLGLNIVFNLVNAKLHGAIVCLNTEQGCEFKITVPI